MSDDSYKLRFFSSSVPPARRNLLILFALLFIGVVLAQAFYWLFANAAEPIVMGLPFGMFFIVMVIIIEYAGLLVMERVLHKDDKED
ncbi:hypothetical protein [Desulfocurvus sp. DL9XJH121]